MKRLWISTLTVVLGAAFLPSTALARGKFDPTTEFEQHEWVPIHIGPLNLSITKAVVYLFLGTGLTILLGLFLMRSRGGKREAVGEQIYEIAQVQIAEQGLPSKAIGRWFPYVASLLLFIFVLNLIGWAAGAVGYGILGGAVVGVPAGITAVYFRYREALS